MQRTFGKKPESDVLLSELRNRTANYRKCSTCAKRNVGVETQKGCTWVTRSVYLNIQKQKKKGLCDTRKYYQTGIKERTLLEQKETNLLLIEVESTEGEIYREIRCPTLGYHSVRVTNTTTQTHYG